jgi:hypothetical protein
VADAQSPEIPISRAGDGEIASCTSSPRTDGRAVRSSHDRPSGVGTDLVPPEARGARRDKRVIVGSGGGSFQNQYDYFRC